MRSNLVQYERINFLFNPDHLLKQNIGLNYTILLYFLQEGTRGDRESGSFIVPLVFQVFPKNTIPSAAVYGLKSTIALVPVIQPAGGIICKSFNVHIRLTTLDTLSQKHQWNQGDNKKTTFPVPLA